MWVQRQVVGMMCSYIILRARVTRMPSWLMGEPEPEDVNPLRDEEADLDSEDDGDEQLQSFIQPKGFQVAAAPPASQLDYSDLVARKVLIGRTILFNWAVV